MELLSHMVATPLFYQRLMLHDPSGAAPLRLALACLTLHDSPLAAPPFARSADRASSAAASKLVAVQPPYTTGARASCWLGWHRLQRATAAPAPWLQAAWAVMPLPAPARPCQAAAGVPARDPSCPAAALAAKGQGAAELLAARGFALLLMLAECEEPSYMDAVGGWVGGRAGGVLLMAGTCCGCVMAGR